MRPDGSPVATDLTDLFLEQVNPAFENPVIVLRYTRDLPDATWRLACKKMRDNASFMVYSDACVVPAMVHCGICPEDAARYTMHGCNWPDIPGVQHQLGTHQAVLPRYVLEALAGLDELVLRSRQVSLDDLRAALARDFDGAEPRRRLCLRAPKFGQDDEAADGHAVRLLTGVLEEIDRASGRGTDAAVIVFRCPEPDMRHLRLRITGYSAVFVDMARHAQDEIIRREEMACRPSETRRP